MSKFKMIPFKNNRILPSKSNLNLNITKNSIFTEHDLYKKKKNYFFSKIILKIYAKLYLKLKFYYQIFHIFFFNILNINPAKIN